jgi:hypothetical protein
MRKYRNKEDELLIRKHLTKAINDKIRKLKEETGRDWKATSISTSVLLDNFVFAILLESCS